MAGEAIAAPAAPIPATLIKSRRFMNSSLNVIVRTALLFEALEPEHGATGIKYPRRFA
jgi:hypothetical protein